MTGPASELAVRAAWESGQRRALLDQACSRAEREAGEAERAEAERVAEAADQAEFAAWRRTLTGEPTLTVSAVLQRSLMAEDGPSFDRSQPVGSPANPATFVDGVLLDPVPPVQRSESDMVLEQAQRMHTDPYMAVMVRRFGHRRSGRREVTRALGPDDAIDCFGCRDVGATLEQSLLLHADPDAHPGLAAEMDPPVEHSARSWSGTGWPSQAPMIYRLRYSTTALHYGTLGGMSLTIKDTEITSDLTNAVAEYRPHAAADGKGAWVMSARPGRLLDRNQAITAMTIEEERARPVPSQVLIEALEGELRG